MRAGIVPRAPAMLVHFSAWWPTVQELRVMGTHLGG